MNPSHEACPMNPLTQARLLARRLFLAFGMLAGSLLAQTASADAPETVVDPSAEEVADSVQRFYDKTTTFSATFKQRYTVKAFSMVKDSQGRVVFQKPGKMSWRYTNNSDRVVSDGNVIKVYESENKQMYEQTMGKSQYPAALAFLVGGGNLRKSFQLKKLDPKDLGFVGGYVLLAVPHEKTPAYQKMLVYVDGKTFQVRRVLLLDAQGNRNRFDFIGPVVNKPPAPGEFRFAPPPGTRVIRP